MQRRLTPGDNADVATIMDNVASMMEDSNRLDEAETIPRAAMAMWQRLAKGDHPNVATSIAKLAHILQARNQLVETEALYRQALAMRQRLFKAGPEIVYVNGGRELARWRLEAPDKSANTLVVVADPDFDATPEAILFALSHLRETHWPASGVQEVHAPSDNLAGTPALDPTTGIAASANPHWDSASDAPAAGADAAESTAFGAPTLDGAPGEWRRIFRGSLDNTGKPDPANTADKRADTFIKAISDTAAKAGLSTPEPLTKRQASKEALMLIKRPRVLVVATHGWYAPAAPESFASESDRPSLKSQQGDGPNVLAQEPMLRSTLIMAGSNTRSVQQSAPKTDAEPSAPTPRANADGILTAMELSGVDLNGTELVMLTACHSGQGDLMSGEGVAGLRSALSAAGARSIVASLWEVPADESLEMTKDMLAEMFKPPTTPASSTPGTATPGTATPDHPKPPSRYAAFRAAQLKALANARANHHSGHPWFWAGFVYCGDPGDIEFAPSAPPAASEDSAPPRPTTEKPGP